MKRAKQDLQDDLRDLALECKALARQSEKLWHDYLNILFGKPEVGHLVCDACEEGEKADAI